MRSTLLEMLTYCRPMGSGTEQLFRRRWLYDLPGAYVDDYQNIHVKIGESRTLWSSHTDTVHGRDGYQGVQVSDTGIASLAPDPRWDNVPRLPAVNARAYAPIPKDIKLSRKQRRKRERARTFLDMRRTCLGADDTVGVYLMYEMIRARVPGYYVFHHGEERGGVGSSSLARAHGAYLSAHFDRAIALDRQDHGDIVISQFSERTASNAFAHALGAAINDLDGGLVYTPAHGVYTDTAEYAAHIPECTNLSVGYRYQHTSAETVDLRHVDRLLGVLCDLRPDEIPASRDPRVVAPVSPFDDLDDGITDRWSNRGLLLSGFDYTDDDGEDWDYQIRKAIDASLADDPPDDTADLRPSGVDAPFSSGRSDMSPVWGSRYRRPDYIKPVKPLKLAKGGK